MLIQNARVTELDGHGRMKLETSRRSSCSGCQQRSGCGVAGVNEYFSTEQVQVLWLQNKLSAEPGDWVELAVEEPDFLKAIFIAYLLPIVTMLIGAAAFDYLFGYLAHDLLAFVGMVFGLCFGLFVSQCWGGSENIEPKAVRVLARKAL